MPQRALAREPADDAGWRDALDELEDNLRAALGSIERLRARLEGAPEPAEHVESRVRELGKVGQEMSRLANGNTNAPFERLWERLEQERHEKQQSVEAGAAARHGLELLPHQYLMTVEDREQTVDLVPLHRSLQGLTGVQEVSLVSFANGVPVVSLRTDRELDFDQVQSSVTFAMDRECEVIEQGNNKIFLRLKPLSKPGQ